MSDARAPFLVDAGGDAGTGPREFAELAAVRAIWHAWQTGDRLQFRGEHFQHTLMTPFSSPGPDEMLTAFAAIGSPAEAAAQLRERYADLVTRLSFYTSEPLPEESATAPVAALTRP